ncbi:hypothetical protein ATO12_24650 [Aquimarina atlantica]|uniref:Uncharacterized protein n=1 Tax=Aquimarina atlantica TaxID=1317122 RepID=A0A023BPY6_9FLAO|nr:DUF6326 family protein [Aquimarina atlantica]EZH72130.1 hypothetical protein ATO12_24650 [Aquimarina atlantica]
MFENPKVNIRIKLAALWTSLMFLYIYGDYFELYIPNKVDSLLKGTELLDTPIKLFIASFSLVIPAAMISANVFLKPKICRILNIIFGILLTIIVVIVGSFSLTKWYSFYAFYAALEAIITLIIIKLAWKWPKELN